jgi:hypothetical protein
VIAAVTDTSTNRFIEKALDSRSGPYVWLRKNYAEIAAAIALQARPSWKALAKSAADDGCVFAPDTLRKAWKRLRRDLARAGGAPAQSPVASTAPAVAPTPAAKPVPEPTGTLTADDENYKEVTMTASDGKTTKTIRIPRR